jgi:hypothetical protein
MYKSRPELAAKTKPVCQIASGSKSDILWRCDVVTGQLFLQKKQIIQQQLHCKLFD